MNTKGDTQRVREDLRELLKSKAEEKNGRAYVRSRFIRDELGSSSKQVGHLINEIHERGDPKGEIEVEKWGRTGGIRWEVTLNE